MSNSIASISHLQSQVALDVLNRGHLIAALATMKPVLDYPWIKGKAGTDSGKRAKGDKTLEAWRTKTDEIKLAMYISHVHASSFPSDVVDIPAPTVEQAASITAMIRKASSTSTPKDGVTRRTETEEQAYSAARTYVSRRFADAKIDTGYIKPSEPVKRGKKEAKAATSAKVKSGKAVAVSALFDQVKLNTPDDARTWAYQTISALITFATKQKGGKEILGILTDAKVRLAPKAKKAGKRK